MKIFSVHEPAGGGRSPAQAQDIVFIKEGMSWPALFFPLLWQIWHGMWLVLVAYLAVGAAIEFVLRTFAGDALAGIGALGFALLFALEANQIRRWHLARRGFELAGVVAGRDLEEAEFRFFSGWQDSEQRAPQFPATPLPAAPRPIAQQPVATRAAPIGVFPQPGGRS